MLIFNNVNRNKMKKPSTIEVGKDKQIALKGDDINKAVFALRAINNPLRKKIIDFINDNPNIIVSEIYKKLRLEQSVTSQHLAILRKANYLTGTRNGQKIHYTVNEERFAEVRDLINKMNK